MKILTLPRILLSSLFFILVLGTAQAEVITLPSTQEVTVEEYGSEKAKYHILWMHSERGISGDLQKILLNISKKESIQILLPDWLDSYFIAPSRSSLNKIPQQDYEDLISHYSKYFSKFSNNKFFLVATSRAASTVLKATHHLQTQGNNDIAGIIFISAYLRKPNVDIGKELEFQQIASYSNLPLYVFQPERSPRFVPLPLMIKALEKGGGPVFTHVLKNITGGFHAREASDLTERDMQARKKFPKQIANALSVLEMTEKTALKKLSVYKKVKRKKKQNHLQKVTLATPKLELNDLNGKPYKLSDYKGKAVLISFWASWCRPCIEEMPSLVKLKEKYKDNLEILAINVREDKATIEKFTNSMNINFPLLQDLDSSAVENWKVYVYPSNFLIDNTGKLRFAATGAMDWQERKREELIETLWQ